MIKLFVHSCVSVSFVTVLLSLLIGDGLYFLDKIDLKDSMLLMCHYMFSCWHTVNGKIEFH